MNTIPKFALQRGVHVLAWVGAGGAVHSAVLWYAGLWNQVQLLAASYLFNGFLGAVLLVALLTLAARNKSNLGFFYMGGSLIKFLGFFVWFYPAFKADAVMDAIEAATFFVPYFIVLIFNTVALIRLLNSPDSGS